MAEVTTQSAVAGSDFGLGDIGSALLGWGSGYVNSWIESRFEPAPTTTAQQFTDGVNTAPIVNEQGANVGADTTNQPVSLMNNQYFVYGLYGVIGLIALLLILKLFGVL